MSFRGTSIPSHGKGSVVEEVAALPCRSKLCDDESDLVLGSIASASPASSKPINETTPSVDDSDFLSSSEIGVFGILHKARVHAHALR